MVRGELIGGGTPQEDPPDVQLCRHGQPRVEADILFGGTDNADPAVRSQDAEIRHQILPVGFGLELGFWLYGLGLGLGLGSGLGLGVRG